MTLPGRVEWGKVMYGGRHSPGHMSQCTLCGCCEGVGVGGTGVGARSWLEDRVSTGLSHREARDACGTSGCCVACPGGAMHG